MPCPANLSGGVVLLAGRTQAAPITVSAGDVATFNFDLTNEVPPPLYLRVGVDVQLRGLDVEPPPCSGPNGECAPWDLGEWTFWTELDGTGTILFNFPALNLNAVWNVPEMEDGVFSATVRVTQGSVAVDPIVCGIAADGSRTPDCPRVPPPPVSEPATLALLVSGTAAGLLRRARSPSRG